MKKAILLVLVAILPVAAVLAQSAITSDTELVITIAGQGHRYQPRPELGYVVKSRDNDQALASAYRSISSSANMQIRCIDGRDHQGLWIVESRQEPDRNVAVMEALNARSEIQYAAPLFTSDGQTVTIIPEIVVRVESGIGIGQVHKLCKGLSLRVKRRMMFTKQEYLLDVLGKDATAVFNAVVQLNEKPFVEWAAPNVAFQAKLSGQTTAPGADIQRELHTQADEQNSDTSGVIPNDEYFSEQWHLHNTGQFGYTPDADINAPEAWEITTGDPNIVVAVCDTGVELNHPDLVNNLVPGYDFYDGDDDPSPTLGDEETHGMMCAGFISAQGNNGIGVAGVTWNCKIMPIRMRIYTDIPRSAVADGIRWAAANGADIVNHSWGQYNPMPIVHSAIVDVTKPGGIGRDGKGCIIIACAHNTNGDVHYPARFPEVIAVGATDGYDERWDYSCHGPELDIMAPSGSMASPWTLGIWTTDITGVGGWSSWNTDPNILDYVEGCAGTSVSAPIVAGVAALILSVEPDLTNEEVRHFLTRSAKDLGEPGRDDYYGWGRVDARAALDMVLTARADLHKDGKVDLRDLLVLIDYWRTNDPLADIAPATKRDGIVDEKDLELLMQYWETEYPEMGLIAHWKLDETEGNIAYDSVDVNDAVVIGEAIWQPEGGMVDGALQLDGIDDYVSTPFVLNPADGAFSVFAWIKGGAPGEVVISQTDGTGSGQTWLGTEPSEGKLMTGLVHPLIGRVDPLPLVSESVITDGAWHHIGLVLGGSYRYLYVDGVEAAKDTTALPYPLKSSDGGLYIGAGKALDAGTFFTGLIDDVRIYGRAISP